MAHAAGVVAVINTSPDVVAMLRVALERAGYLVVTAFTHEIRDGHVDIEAFVEQHQPTVIIYDIAPPYEANWQLFQHVRQMPAMEGRFFVVTTTNARHLQQLAGNVHQVHEIVGKPFDLDEIVEATRQALKARPTR